MGFLQDIGTLLMVVFLQIVLGFDNLLYISIESKKAPVEKQSYVRKVGIGIAIGLRIVLLVILLQAISYLNNPLFIFDIPNVISIMPDDEGHGGMTFHALVVLVGGVFILYTAIKEIAHMITLEDDTKTSTTEDKKVSIGQLIGWIVVMNLVFSFDSILSAIALTKKVWIISGAIIFSGIAMIALADKVSEFLQRNRMFEVLGLFVLLIVGVMLLSEGGHLANLTFLGKYEVHAMNKATFYFVIITLVIVDLIQSRYQKVLDKRQPSEASEASEEA
jgi:predicted tellurium resistance membrane protein TerC